MSRQAPGKYLPFLPPPAASGRPCRAHDIDPKLLASCPMDVIGEFYKDDLSFCIDHMARPLNSRGLPWMRLECISSGTSLAMVSLGLVGWVKWGTKSRYLQPSASLASRRGSRAWCLSIFMARRGRHVDGEGVKEAVWSRGKCGELGCCYCLRQRLNHNDDYQKLLIVTTRLILHSLPQDMKCEPPYDGKGQIGRPIRLRQASWATLH